MSPDRHPKRKKINPDESADSTPHASENKVPETPAIPDYVARLNKSVLSMFVGTLNKDPQADLGPIIAKYNTDYGTRRQKAQLKHGEKLKELSGQFSLHVTNFEAYMY